MTSRPPIYEELDLGDRLIVRRANRTEDDSGFGAEPSLRSLIILPSATWLALSFSDHPQTRKLGRADRDTAADLGEWEVAGS